MHPGRSLSVKAFVQLRMSDGLGIFDLQEQLSLSHSDDFALDQGVFIELVDGTQSVVAIGNHHLTVLFVSWEKERRGQSWSSTSRSHLISFNFALTILGSP